MALQTESSGINKGYQMSQEGFLEGAIDYYAQGLRIDNMKFELLFNLGWIYNTMNRWSVALHWMAKAHITNPDEVRPLYGLAVITLKLAQYRESLDLTLQASSMQIDDEIMKINLLYLTAVINK